MTKKKRGRKRTNQIMKLARRGFMPVMSGVTGAILTGALVGYAQKQGMLPTLNIDPRVDQHVLPIAAGGLPGALGAAIVRGATMGNGGSGGNGFPEGY